MIAPAAKPAPTPQPQRGWACALPLVTARVPTSVRAAKVAAVIFDLVMAVSILLNRWQRSMAAIQVGRGCGGKGSKPEPATAVGAKGGSMTLRRAVLLGFLIVLAGAPAWVQVHAQTLDKIRFGTNWLAEAEHGGFYQAVADGTYRKYGLDVTIVPGGPNINNRILLPVGRLDFFMSANSLQAFDAVEHNIPTVAVAASFQKDPQVFVAHPDVAKFDDLKSRTLFVSKEGMTSYFQWLKSDFGFSEAKVRPYTFNAQPFLADKNSAMQGYATSEPYAVEKQGGFKPVVFLLADRGFDAYSTLIESRRDLVEKRPDLVQRFVDASAIGWYHYIYGDSRPGNDLIKKQNPEMTDALLAYSIAKMKEYGIVDSGDSQKLGIGAMTDAHWKSFFDKMVRAGVVKPNIDYKRAYTLQFVNKRVGVDLRSKN